MPHQLTGLGQGTVNPASPGIRGSLHAALAQAGVDGVGVSRVDGKARRTAAAQRQLDRPGVAGLVEAAAYRRTITTAWVPGSRLCFASNEQRSAVAGGPNRRYRVGRALEWPPSKAPCGSFTTLAPAALTRS
jgi:hypothetical protein